MEICPECGKEYDIMIHLYCPECIDKEYIPKTTPRKKVKLYSTDAPGKSVCGSCRGVGCVGCQPNRYL